MEEIQLLERIKSHDKEAFTQLVALYQHRVLNTCYRFLLNREDAEDTAQEVFIEIYHSIHQFRGESKLSTWVYRIAVTKSLDALKKRNRKKRARSIGRFFHIDEVANLLAGGKRPDTVLEEQENETRMQKALDSLPDNQRVAFTLRNIEGYSNPEIAEIMDTSIAAVESLTHRAKKNLTEKIEKLLKKQ